MEHKGILYGLVDSRSSVIKYVGITTKTLDERFTAHIRETQSQRKKSKKICWLRECLKEGWQVKPVLLMDGLSIERLKELEKHFIANFNSTTILQNSTRGGEGAGSNLGHGRRPLLQFSKDGELIAVHESISQAGVTVNIKIGGMPYALKNKTLYKDFYWQYESDGYILSERSKSVVGRRGTQRSVFQFTADGILVAKHESGVDAYRTVSSEKGGLYFAIKKKILYKGFFWQYDSDVLTLTSSEIRQRKKQAEVVKTNLKKGVLQYSENGEFITKHDSLSSAAHSAKSCNSVISKAIQTSKLFKGFYWCYEETAT